MLAEPSISIRIEANVSRLSEFAAQTGGKNFLDVRSQRNKSNHPTRWTRRLDDSFARRLVRLANFGRGD